MSSRHVVIVGGGFGGLTAAKVLRRRALRVTLLDRHNYHLFQPLLYQVATATLSPGDIASPIRWIVRRSPNVRVLLGEADSIDVAGRRVLLTDGAAVAYDYLIVATGSSHAYFGHEEWARDAPGLKTLEDALEIRRRVLLAFERAECETDPARQQELLTFVLVGGGPTGVELAGTLAEIARRTLRDEFRSIDPSQARIVLVEAGPTILQTFPPTLRDAARSSLLRAGHRRAGGHGGDLSGCARRHARTGATMSPVPSCGPPVWPPHRSSRRLVSRGIVLAASLSRPICRFQDILKSSLSAMRRCSSRTGSHCQAWRRPRCRRLRMRRG